MPDLTINLSKTARETLMQIAETSGETVQTVLDKAIENDRRYIFLTRANQAFAELRQDEALWQEEQAERDLWGRAVANGNAG